MEYKVYDYNSYRIHTIKTDKFKNCTLEIMFRNKLEKDKITENNMLVDTLMYSSKKYPTRRDVSVALENLYCSSVRGVISRTGESYIISFITDFLNPKYCEEGYLEDIIAFPFEMILNPNITCEEFDRRSFNIVKNRLKADILSLKENAMRYALRRSLCNMDSESISSYNMVGNIDDLDNITTSSLVNTYYNMLNDSICDIYVIGNLDMDYIVELIRKNFVNKTIKDNELGFFINNKLRSKVLDIEEHGDYEQDSFVMVYNLDKLTKRESYLVMRLFNLIFGTGGLTSKLYRYLREENSLCYSVSSMFQLFDNLLIIYAGIEKKDKNKCVKLVKKALKEMVNGEFSDEELENAKKNCISSLKMSIDTPSGNINSYLFHELLDFPLFDERIKDIKSVTKEEIINVAKKIKLNTIYLLSGGDK